MPHRIQACPARRFIVASAVSRFAEKGTRTAPGLKGDGSEFAPYFDALRDIGYAGGVSCECGWGDRKDFAKNLETALATMKRLAGQA